MKIAKRVCTQLVADHQITSCSDQLVEWKEPEFVQRVHDLGTKLALHFVSYILEDPDLLERLKQKLDWFITHLILSTLQKAGFDIPHVWAAMRNSPVTDEQIVGLTEASSRLLLEGIRRRPRSRASYCWHPRFWVT